MSGDEKQSPEAQSVGEVPLKGEGSISVEVQGDNAPADGGSDSAESE